MAGLRCVHGHQLGLRRRLLIVLLMLHLLLSLLLLAHRLCMLLLLLLLLRVELHSLHGAVRWLAAARVMVESSTIAVQDSAGRGWPNHRSRCDGRSQRRM